MYDFDGLMDRVFASETSNTSSNPVDSIFFLLFKCFMFDLVFVDIFQIFIHFKLIIFIYA